MAQGSRNFIFFIIIIACVVFALTCMVMSIVFSYVPSLVYPEEIVNVNVVNVNGTLTEFYLRCDIAGNGKYRSDLLKDCESSGFIIEPDCNIPNLHSYWYKTFAFGEVDCSSGYLEQFTRTENLSINLIALASSMMIIGTFLFMLPIVLICSCN